MFSGTGGEFMEYTCDRKDCEVKFIKKTHNQKYCSNECCRVATNRRIMDKYYDRKAVRNGRKRFCTKCEGDLSKYNSTQICSACTIKSKSNANAAVALMISNSVIL